MFQDAGDDCVRSKKTPRDFNYKKAVQALNFFAEKEGNKINYMKALKLIWLADRLHVNKFSRTITGDKYFAMKNGPVASCTYDIILKSEFANEKWLEYSDSYIVKIGYDIESQGKFDEDEFSDSDLNILEAIYDRLGHSTEKVLSNESHLFPEWFKHEKAIENDDKKREDIDILDFLETPRIYLDIFNESEEKLVTAREELKFKTAIGNSFS